LHFPFQEFSTPPVDISPLLVSLTETVVFSKHPATNLLPCS